VSWRKSGLGLQWSLAAVAVWNNFLRFGKWLCLCHYGPNSSENFENRVHALSLELHKHQSTSGIDLTLRKREGRYTKKSTQKLNKKGNKRTNKRERKRGTRNSPRNHIIRDWNKNYHNYILPKTNLRRPNYSYLPWSSNCCPQDLYVFLAYRFDVLHVHEVCSPLFVSSTYISPSHIQTST
jgi:hypothetical protein